MKMACPNCNKANLDIFEINSEESIFMCTNPDVSYFSTFFFILQDIPFHCFKNINNLEYIPDIF